MTDSRRWIAPTRFTHDTAEGALAGWRWPNEGKPPLLFCHATGFCASVYKQMLQLLSDDFDIFALDMRGHGRTSLPVDPHGLRSWRIYARDISAFLDWRSQNAWTLSGHSMGAVTAAMAATGRCDIQALKLIEPVAMHPLYALAAKTPFWGLAAARIPLVRQASKRRSAWRDKAAAQASYARKALFRKWVDGVLEDYLEDGLTKTANGVALACDPVWEAATFAAQANDFWPAVARAPAPVAVLAAGPGSSTVGPDARRRFRRCGAAVTSADSACHLIPMEDPVLSAEFILGAPICS